MSQIRLIEAETAVELILLYRSVTGNGSILIANQIEKEAALWRERMRRLDVGTPVTKSVVDSWIFGGKSLPQSSHLLRLNAFFKSRIFRSVIPEVEYLWDPIKATVGFGRHLLKWNDYDKNGFTDEMDGDWAASHMFPSTEINSASANWWERNSLHYLRLKWIRGENFGVAHRYERLRRAEIWSGFIFKIGPEYAIILRNRMQLRRIAAWVLSRDTRVDLDGMNFWLFRREGDGAGHPQASPGVMIRNSGVSVPEEAKKFFDSHLWSVIPHV